MGSVALKTAAWLRLYYHGLPKISSIEGHQAFAITLGDLNVPAPGFMAWVAGVVEVAGGVALIVGVFVVVASVLHTIDMLVAMFKVHLAADSAS